MKLKGLCPRSLDELGRVTVVLVELAYDFSDGPEKLPSTMSILATANLHELNTFQQNLIKHHTDYIVW